MLHYQPIEPIGSLSSQLSQKVLEAISNERNHNYAALIYYNESNLVIIITVKTAMSFSLVAGL